MSKEDTLYILKKKSVHVNLDKVQHGIFRSKLFLHGLTMQQYIEMMILHFNIETPSVIKLVEKEKVKIKEKELEKLRGINKKDLYDAIEKYSPKFEQRVFTSSEISYCQTKGNSAKHFAARFAVKEAVSKCLGTGITGLLGFKDMEVINEETGKPVLKMIGKGEKLFQKLKLKTIHISISHDRTHAIAHAIAEQ